MSLQDFSSLLTVVVAVVALFSWRKQEQLKVKLAFKNAIADYANQLKKIASHSQRPTEAQNQKLEELFNACHHALLITEGLLDNNQVVTKSWRIIKNQTTLYMIVCGDDESSQNIQDACEEILNEKFVFSSYSRVIKSIPLFKD